MENQEQQEEWGPIKKAIVFIVFLGVSALYFFGLDKVMMGPAQNLPFPYK